MATFAATISAPSGSATVEGNVHNCIPFTCDEPEVGRRYQQVYDASLFSGNRQVRITAIAFRPSAIYHDFEGPISGPHFEDYYPFAFTLENIQVNLSTTSAAPDALSAIFADNVGLDSRVVFSGPVTFSGSAPGPRSGPNPFDLVLNLQTPFMFDPPNGNLLMDVQNVGALHGDRGVFLDAVSVTSDEVSRVFRTGFTDTFGLVTKFQYDVVEVVREPSTRATVAILFLSAILLKKRRHRFQA